MKLNSNSEIQQVECRTHTDADELLLAESLIRKGKLLESDTLQTGTLEKSGTKSEATNDEKASSSERDMTQAKAKMVKGRQTQSGPLVPGAVLGHSLSDKGRFWERFVYFSVHFVLQQLLCIGMFGVMQSLLHVWCYYLSRCIIATLLKFANIIIVSFIKFTCKCILISNALWIFFEMYNHKDLIIL